MRPMHSKRVALQVKLPSYSLKNRPKAITKRNSLDKGFIGLIEREKCKQKLRSCLYSKSKAYNSQSYQAHVVRHLSLQAQKQVIEIQGKTTNETLASCIIKRKKRKTNSHITRVENFLHISFLGGILNIHRWRKLVVIFK